MPNFQALSPSSHAALRWKRYDNYQFVARDALAPLVAQELPKACTCLPIAWLPQGEQFVPTAVLGLQTGQNLLVAPNGRWLGAYVPAAYRGQPFALARTPADQWVLCTDADSPWVAAADASTHDLAFFDEQGQITPPVKDVFNFLQQVHANRQRTEQACAVLQAHGLIVPWTLTLQGEQGQRELQGLYRTDEARLNTLEPEALQRLQQTGALMLAYCQLISMQHVHALGQLAQDHAQAAHQAESKLPVSSNGDLDLEFLARDGTLNFGNW